MNWFLNLKVGTKLLTGFALVAVIAGFVGYEGIMSLKAADASDTILYERNTVPLGNIAEIGVAFQRLRVNALVAATSASKAVRDDQISRIADRRAEIVKGVAEFEKSIATDDVRKAFDEFGASRKEFVPLLDQFVTLSQAGRSQEAMTLWNGEMDKARAREQNAIAALSEFDDLPRKNQVRTEYR